jgi:hypothetical protein
MGNPAVGIKLHGNLGRAFQFGLHPYAMIYSATDDINVSLDSTSLATASRCPNVSFRCW